MEEAIRDPRLVLLVVIPRTAWAANATRTTEEAEDRHRTVGVKETTMKEPTMEEPTTMEKATME